MEFISTSIDFSCVGPKTGSPLEPGQEADIVIIKKKETNGKPTVITSIAVCAAYNDGRCSREPGFSCYFVDACTPPELRKTLSEIENNIRISK